MTSSFFFALHFEPYTRPKWPIICPKWLENNQLFCRCSFISTRANVLHLVVGKPAHDYLQSNKTSVWCGALILLAHNLIAYTAGSYNLIKVISIESTCHTNRVFSHLRLIIVLAIALNTWDFKTNADLEFVKNFQSDLNYCADCFKHQKDACTIFHNALAEDSDISIWQLVTVLPQRVWKRINRMSVLKSTQDKIISKYLANSEEHFNWIPETEELKRVFLQNDRLNGIQYYPKERVMNLISFLQIYHKDLSEKCLWLYLLVNAQPLIMPILYELKFPVPKPHITCGFTLHQEYAGVDLYHLNRKEFVIKLNIAHQILNAAIQLSFGFGNFRLYITDFTADNMVYDMTRERLGFVDLDTLLIVDSTYAKHKSAIHKHEYIDCHGCFAYAPDDIRSYNVSDINIYSACQFFREDLYKDASKGFLSPLPAAVVQSYPKFVELLDRCVVCPQLECWNRFAVAEDLLHLVEIMLKDLSKK